MKRIIFILILAALAGHTAQAQTGKGKKDDPKTPAPAAHPAKPPADPVAEFLKQPTDRGYRLARARLDTLLARDPQDRQNLVRSFAVDKANLDCQVDRLYAERDSLDDQATFGLANFLLDAKDYGRAIALYDQLNAKTPKWSCPWRHKGQALYQQGKLEDAEKSLLKAIDARAVHYDAYVWLARVQRDQQRFGEALETLKRGFAAKYKDAEDPEKEVKDGEDVKLLDDLLLQNMVQPDQVVEERNKIIKAAGKKK
jgi:tetratricopeptide (TPR) repeat protein